MVNFINKLKIFLVCSSVVSTMFIVFEANRFVLFINGKEYPLYFITFLMIFNLSYFFTFNYLIFNIIKSLVNSAFLFVGFKLFLSFFFIHDVVCKLFGGFIVIKQVLSFEEKLYVVKYLFNNCIKELEPVVRERLVWDETEYLFLVENSKTIKELSDGFLDLLSARVALIRECLMQEALKSNSIDWLGGLSVDSFLYYIAVGALVVGGVILLGYGACWIFRVLKDISADHITPAIARSMTTTERLNAINVRILNIQEQIRSAAESVGPHVNTLSVLVQQSLVIAQQMDEIALLVEVTNATGVATAEYERFLQLRGKFWFFRICGVGGR